MNYLKSIIRLFSGSVVFALGTIVTMDSNIGYGPWDVLHAGISYITPLTIGQASIAVGTILILIDFLVKEAVGISTIGTLFVVGWFIDLFKLLPIHPVLDNYVFKLLYLILGLFICALGVYLYMSAELGTGPRDGVMVAIRRHFKIPVGLSRYILEMAAALVGWLLGGPIGLGTIVYALAFGTALQIIFGLFRFEPTKLNHHSLKDSWLLFQKTIQARKNLN